MDTNTVTLVGRLSAPPTTVTLPSGDELVSFRLVVERSAAARRRSKQTVDTFECSVWPSRLRRRVLRLEPGTTVRVGGELRRRFSRAGGAPASWVSVDAALVEPVADPSVRSSA
jgi:single-strand DNA-binding protein